MSIEEALDAIIQEEDLSNSKTTLEIKETDDEIEVSDEDNEADKKWLFMYSPLKYANECFWIIQIVRCPKISIIQVKELLIYRFIAIQLHHNYIPYYYLSLYAYYLHFFSS